MEGESPLLKEGALSLQTSLSHRELSHRTPPLQERKFVSLFVTAGFCGKVFFRIGRCGIFCRVRLRAQFVGGNIYETHSTNQSGAKPHRQKNTSRQKRKLPPRAPAKAKRNKLSQCKAGALGEGFLLLGETRISCRMRLSHSFCGGHISQICPARVPAGGILALT